MRESRAFYSGRARYVNRALNPALLMQTPPVYSPPISEVWTDYNGDAPYRDFTISGGQAANGDAYVPGVWHFVAGVAEYLHNDHLGTLRRTTNGSGSSSGLPGASRIFTAFGERVTTGPIDRYGYVGAFGYQQHSEFAFLHVGARWYDPGSGRFLQRDPIGVRGGSNAYSYVWNAPTSDVDPSGLMSIMSMQGVMALIETEIAMHGSYLVTTGGITYKIINLVTMPNPSGRNFMTTLVSTCGRFLHYTYTPNQAINVVRTSGGIVLSPPTCGLTGIEVVPFAALFTFWARRRRHSLPRANRSWLREVLGWCAGFLPGSGRRGGLRQISPHSPAAILNEILLKLCEPLMEDQRPQLDRQIEKMEVEAAVTEVVGPHARRMATALKNFYRFLSEGGESGRRFRVTGIDYLVVERNERVLIRKGFSDGASKETCAAS